MGDGITLTPQHTSPKSTFGHSPNHLPFRRTASVATLGWSLVTSSLGQASPASPGAAIDQPTRLQPNGETVRLPESVPDPFEPINRLVYAVNQGMMAGLVKPTARVYRAVVVKPIRTGIGNFGRNVTFPGRVINNLLQGKWIGARDESYRFACNTTAGVAGLMDVATKWKIAASDADFGQTFGQWGWQPHAFIMLPVFGPSNERDTLGLAADTAANPLTYVSPYPVSFDNPLTYVSPYTYCSYGILYNNLSDTVDDYVRFSRSEKDAYSELQYAWTFVRENRVADFQVRGERDEASLETLQSVFFSPQDPRFPRRGKTRSALIPSTGRKLKFTFWLQPGNAPVVYIVPGLGSHRLAGSAAALAELVYRKGFSAVCVSSTFNFEFMEHASTAAVPAYMPVDVHDLHVALTEIDRRLSGLYPDRLGQRALMGYSMGAFEALFLAATEATQEAPLMRFERYVAINSPVGLVNGISQLDKYFQAPLAWPAGDRAENIENTFLKVAALSKSSLTPQTSLPFSGIESQFLIGTSFRLTLRDVIFSSQQRHNLGVLEQPLKNLRRAKAYREILGYSYSDYLQKFVVPYYASRGVDLSATNSLEKAGNLQTYGDDLHTNHKVRLIVNSDDFLLPERDLAWLQATFSDKQLTVFARGGHLGNLSHPEVQKAIVEALDGLRTPPAAPDKPMAK